MILIITDGWAVVHVNCSLGLVISRGCSCKEGLCQCTEALLPVMVSLIDEWWVCYLGQTITFYLMCSYVHLAWNIDIITIKKVQYAFKTFAQLAVDMRQSITEYNVSYLRKPLWRCHGVDSWLLWRRYISLTANYMEGRHCQAVACLYRLQTGRHTE